MTATADRTYLHVAPEDKAAVARAGACWDDFLKCWYITPAMDDAAFSQWLPDSLADDCLEITSTEACVAITRTPCCSCRAEIEIICLYCESGRDLDEELTQFTVSNISAMDDALTHQLALWPSFKQGMSSVHHSPYFANHCPHCDALQEDLYLHEEPGDPFFSISHTPPEPLLLVALAGPIRCSGSCHFSL